VAAKRYDRHWNRPAGTAAKDGFGREKGHGVGRWRKSIACLRERGNRRRRSLKAMSVFEERGKKVSSAGARQAVMQSGEGNAAGTLGIGGKRA